MSEALMPEVTSKRKVFGLISLVLLVTYLYFGISVFGIEAHLPLILGAITATIFGVIDGTKWETIEKGMFQSIMMAMQACIILLVIGMLIASWITGGIVQAMIYYGLSVINPQFYFITALLLSSIVSLATGSSWTTAGTVGIALVGIAGALGINMPMAAGAIVSGAYFGDKMSPLSDTTNLAPAVAGTTLFDHIKSMVYTTVPSYCLAAIIFLIMGFMFAKDATGDLTSIKALQDIMFSAYNINLILLVPPLVIVAMVAFRMPAIPGLFLATFLGVLCTIFIQGQSDFGVLLAQLHNGYEFTGDTIPGAATQVQEFFTEYSIVDNGSYFEGMKYFTQAPEEGKAVMDYLNTSYASANLVSEGKALDPNTLLELQNLLTRGGLSSMLETVALILCAMCFGGAMEASGMLVSLVDSLKRFTDKPWKLVTTSIFTGLATNILASDQYVSIVLPGRMYKESYKKLNLAPRVHSRILEAGGTLTSPLVPWNTCGATMSGFLGVNAFAYGPFALFNLLNPITEIISAAIGWAMFPDDGSDHVKEV